MYSQISSASGFMNEKSYVREFSDVSSHSHLFVTHLTCVSGSFGALKRMLIPRFINGLVKSM